MYRPASLDGGVSLLRLAQSLDELRLLPRRVATTLREKLLQLGHLEPAEPAAAPARRPLTRRGARRLGDSGWFVGEVCGIERLERAVDAEFVPCALLGSELGLGVYFADRREQPRLVNKRKERDRLPLVPLA